MLKNIFPESIYEHLKNIDLSTINEIRLRVGCPITLVGVAQTYIGENGITSDKNEAIIVNSQLIKSILLKVSNNSLYTINDQLIEGYVTAYGYRIGVAGELVAMGESVKTIKNITSLNIRIPHLVKNCSLPIYNYLYSGRPHNTLIISPPGAGKTTFLRDYIYQLSTRNQKLNILVVDERNEIMSIDDSKWGVDVYANCSKSFAFEKGIRSMKPDIIFTDEINLNKDLSAIENAMTSGVKVVASIHANGIDDLKNKKAFSEIINKQLFDRFVVLGFSNGVGTIEAVYNENFRCIYI